MSLEAVGVEDVCEVCDRTGGDIEIYLGDVTAHRSCTATQLEKDRKEAAEFMAEVEKRATKGTET